MDDPFEEDRLKVFTSFTGLSYAFQPGTLRSKNGIEVSGVIYNSRLGTVYAGPDGYGGYDISGNIFLQAYDCGFAIATKKEICEPDDTYTVYHLNVDDWQNNNLVVNGGTVVESWSGIDN